MTFGSPQYLYALLALPALMAFVWWAFARRAALVQRIGDPALIERLSMAVNRGMRRRRFVLWFLGIALIIVALARPQWGSDVQIVEHRGVQVMVALDISRSMLAQDLKPTRLDRAKLEISDLMSRLTGDEVGIVLFSGASFIQFPLTFDYATARTYLRNASPDAITRQGTVIAKAIETAMTGFSEERVSQKIIVIMTDGENHEGDPIAAARQAAEDGAVIYTVGFGSPEGEPVPEYDGQGNVIGYQEDDQGRVVITQLDEATLQQVAQAGGGKYFPRRRARSHRRPRRRDTVVPGREPPERVQPHEHRALPDISARGRALARSRRADDRPALALAVETARDRRRGGGSCLIEGSCMSPRPSSSS